MPDLLTPTRRRGIEILDDPNVDPHLVCRSLNDVARSNTLFGGANAAMQELRDALRSVGKSGTLLDVGTGVGDIPLRARKAAGTMGVHLDTIGLDSAEELAILSREQTDISVCGDGLCLPFRDNSIDIVMCSQVLHHFAGDDAATLIREMDRVARVRVIISDIRRSWVAAAGLWVASFPLGFHPISRHDGVVSVMRGFTPHELRDTVTGAVGHAPRVTKRIGFRVTTSWRPA